MTAPAAIVASLVDVRNLNTEKSVKLTLHVPAERAGMVFEAFGWPTATNPVPVALARLQTSPEPIAKPESPKERRPFSELPYSQQCALRCNELTFLEFLPSIERLSLKKVFTAEGAADVVRQLCGVSSRSEIIKGTPAGDKWEALEAEYYAWQRGGIR